MVGVKNEDMMDERLYKRSVYVICMLCVRFMYVCMPWGEYFVDGRVSSYFLLTRLNEPAYLQNQFPKPTKVFPNSTLVLYTSYIRGDNCFRFIKRR